MLNFHYEPFRLSSIIHSDAVDDNADTDIKTREGVSSRVVATDENQVEVVSGIVVSTD